MSYSFLFFTADNLDIASCISLKIADHKIVEPAQKRTVDEIRLLQEDCTRTIVVLPQQLVSLFVVELPLLNTKKLKRALPFALEENLSQNIEDLHFAFDKSFYKDNHFKVLVTANKLLEEVISILQAEQIEFDAITTEWFALSHNETVITPDGALFCTDKFNGLLSKELHTLYSKLITDTCLSFKESNVDIQKELNLSSQNTESYYAWLSGRLTVNPYINLCQGNYQIQKSKYHLNWWYKLSFITGGVLACAYLLISGFNLYSLDKKIQNLDTEIVNIYQKFFPGSTQVISPKFRIEQLMKKNSKNSSKVYTLLNSLGLAYKNQKIRIDRISYNDKGLDLTLNAADFKALEMLENNLRKMKIDVKQKQATLQNDVVVANLELS